jgi:hypothetical protein
VLEGPQNAIVDVADSGARLATDLCDSPVDEQHFGGSHQVAEAAIGKVTLFDEKRHTSCRPLRTAWLAVVLLVQNVDTFVCRELPTWATFGERRFGTNNSTLEATPRSEATCASSFPPSALFCCRLQSS